MKKLLAASMIFFTVVSYSSANIAVDSNLTKIDSSKKLCIASSQVNKSKMKENSSKRMDINIFNEHMTTEQKKMALKNFLTKSYANSVIYTPSETTEYINIIINASEMNKLLAENNTLPKSTCIAIQKQMIPLSLYSYGTYGPLSEWWDESMMNNFFAVASQLQQLGYNNFYYLRPNYVNENCNEILKIVKILKDNKIGINAIKCIFHANEYSHCAYTYDNLDKVYQILQLMAASNKLNDNEIQVVFSNNYTKYKWGLFSVNYLTGTHELDKYYDIVTIYRDLKKSGKQFDYTYLRKEFDKKVLKPLNS